MASPHTKQPKPAEAPNPAAYSLLAHALANQGELTDALAWCDRWVAADKLDASGHYLRAVVLQELGDNERARRSLQRAIYLQPGFVLAHFALGPVGFGILQRLLGLGDLLLGHPHFFRPRTLLSHAALLPGVIQGHLRQLESSAR